MSKLFFPAPEVAAIGEELIEHHHAHLHEHNARVEFVFVSETPVRNGKAIWGQARKISSLSSYLKREREIEWEPGLTEEEIAAIEDEDMRFVAGVEKQEAIETARERGNAAFFVIVLAKPIWDMMNHAGRCALVDHELMHCGARYDRKGNTELFLIPHDFEGFNAEIERHGLWRLDAAHLADQMKNAQLTFSFEGEDAAPEADAESVSATITTGGVSVTIDGSLLPAVTKELKKRGRPRKNFDAIAVAVQ